MATITVDVLDFNLALTGSGPITSAFDLQYDEPLSACGMFRFRMPAQDSDHSLLTVQKSVVRIYADNAEKFLGIVERKTLTIPQTGIAVYEISGRSFLAELTDDSVEFMTIASAGAGVTSGPTDILAEHDESWSLDTINGDSNTSTSVYARFVGENCLTALVMVTDRIGEHFIYKPSLSGADRKVIWIQSIGTDSGVRAIQGADDPVGVESNDNVCLIQNLEQIKDGTEVITFVRPYGGTQDRETSALTLAASTYGTVGDFTVFPSTNGVQYTEAEITQSYRRRELHLQFPNITALSNTDTDQQSAANALADATMSWLERHGLPHTFYALTVTKLPTSVKPGDGIRVIYYEEDDNGTVVHNIDEVLNVLAVETTYGNEGSVTYRLTVADTDRMPDSDSMEVVNRLEQGRVYQAYRQMAPSVDTLTYAEPFDDSESASIPFWLGPEIFQLQSVLLRFRIDPLRSTVKSISGSSTTSDSGGGSTPTTSDGGSSTPTSGTGDHSHPLNIPNGTVANNIGLDAGGGIVNESGSLATPSTQFETGGHTHTVSIGNHSHTVTIAAHTHTLTPNISSVYGIFEDSGGTVIDDSTLANLKNEITVEVNGVDETADIVASTVSGWWELELTDYTSVMDADTFRPADETHEVTVIAQNSGDRGRVTAQLQVRALIQAVAYT